MRRYELSISKSIHSYFRWENHNSKIHSKPLWQNIRHKRPLYLPYLPAPQCITHQLFLPIPPLSPYLKAVYHPPLVVFLNIIRIWILKMSKKCGVRSSGSHDIASCCGVTMWPQNRNLPRDKKTVGRGDSGSIKWSEVGKVLRQVLYIIPKSLFDKFSVWSEGRPVVHQTKNLIQIRIDITCIMTSNFQIFISL